MADARVPRAFSLCEMVCSAAECQVPPARTGTGRNDEHQRAHASKVAGARSSTVPRSGLCALGPPLCALGPPHYATDVNPTSTKDVKGDVKWGVK